MLGSSNRIAHDAEEEEICTLGWTSVLRRLRRVRGLSKQLKPKRRSPWTRTKARLLGYRRSKLHVLAACALRTIFIRLCRVHDTSYVFLFTSRHLQDPEEAALHSAPSTLQLSPSCWYYRSDRSLVLLYMPNDHLLQAGKPHTFGTYKSCLS